MLSSKTSTLQDQWANHLWNLFSETRAASHADPQVLLDLVGIMLWFAICAKADGLPLERRESFLSSWSRFLGSSSQEVRNLLEPVLSEASQEDMYLREALEYLNKKSLMTLGTEEILSVAQKIDHLALSQDIEVRRAIVEAYQRLAIQTDWKSGMSTSPIALTKLIVELADPTPTDVIYDPFAGMGGFLLEAWRHLQERSVAPISSHNFHIHGQEINLTAGSRAILIAHIAGCPFAVTFGNSLTPTYRAWNPTLVISDPPLGGVSRSGRSNVERVSMFGSVPVPTSVAQHFDSLAQILQDIAPEHGRALVVLPPRLLFGGGATARARQELVQQDLIEAVITLPKGLYLPHTSLGLCLVTFNYRKPLVRQNKVLLIDGESLGRPKAGERFSQDLFEQELPRIVEAYNSGEALDRLSVVVTADELKAQEWDLTPSRYFPQPGAHEARQDLAELAREASASRQRDQAAQETLWQEAKQLLEMIAPRF